jgi:hypothetical protein
MSNDVGFESTNHIANCARKVLTQNGLSLAFMPPKIGCWIRLATIGAFHDGIN